MMLFEMRVKLESLFCLLALFWLCSYLFCKLKRVLLYSSNPLCQSMTVISSTKSTDSMAVFDAFLLEPHRLSWLFKDIPLLFYNHYFGPGSPEPWSTCVTSSKWCNALLHQGIYKDWTCVVLGFCVCVWVSHEPIQNCESLLPVRPEQALMLEDSCFLLG